MVVAVGLNACRARRYVGGGGGASVGGIDVVGLDDSPCISLYDVALEAARETARGDGGEGGGVGSPPAWVSRCR
jgi:hypothetical protein